LGIKTPSTESSLQKLFGYFGGGFSPDPQAIIITLLVISTMLFWPKKWNARFPASLLGIILATVLTTGLNWNVPKIGSIPQTLLLAERFNPLSLDWAKLDQFIAPALTITALGAIESLLCGSVAANMTGIRLQANQELVGQGIGNILIPLFGGVPATAAIARTSVGIKSGGQTRLVSILHAVGLLLSMFLLAPLMAVIPLAGLAGVLMVTAWRMNEWLSIRFMFAKKFKTDILAFGITMLATIALDLTQAILIGSLLAGAIFLNRIANLEITINQVDAEKLQAKGITVADDCKHIKVAFLTGPLFFAATGIFTESFSDIGDTHVLILSMRGVPLLDTAGVETIRRLYDKIHQQGGSLMFAGVHDNVMNLIKRSGLHDEIGAHNFFWSSDQAIVEAEKRSCNFCNPV
jgi:SulP family sulfate permease